MKESDRKNRNTVNSISKWLKAIFRLILIFECRYGFLVYFKTDIDFSNQIRSNKDLSVIFGSKVWSEHFEDEDFKFAEKRTRRLKADGTYSCFYGP